MAHTSNRKDIERDHKEKPREKRKKLRTTTSETASEVCGVNSHNKNKIVESVTLVLPSIFEERRLMSRRHVSKKSQKSCRKVTVLNNKETSEIESEGQSKNQQQVKSRRHTLRPSSVQSFWTEQPASLRVNASKISRDIDAFSIEVVRRCNEPMVCLPKIRRKQQLP